MASTNHIKVSLEHCRIVQFHPYNTQRVRSINITLNGVKLYKFRDYSNRVGHRSGAMLDALVDIHVKLLRKALPKARVTHEQWRHNQT